MKQCHAIACLLRFRRCSAPAFPADTSGAYELFGDFRGRMTDYDHAREYPAEKSPSYLGVHLKHGTISIRALARTAHDAQRHSDKGTQK